MDTNEFNEFDDAAFDREKRVFSLEEILAMEWGPEPHAELHAASEEPRRFAPSDKFSCAYLHAAHDACTSNQKQLERSTVCGCFYCCQTHSPELIDWEEAIMDPEGLTAMCPLCGIDSVIGDASGYPITREFLEAMYHVWF